jgi:septum site-determining protein MinC
MKSEELVLFKGRNDVIVVMLDAECDFAELTEALKGKVAEAPEFFGGADTSISFSGRKLNGDEEAALTEIFRESAGEAAITVVPLKEKSAARTPRAEGRKTRKPTEDEIRELYARENVTMYHKGSMRSGQSLTYAGSVVLYGDLNPGAEIIAEGNIIILGYAKGLVHAGCSGNKNCFVYALNLQPTQLRIADIISYVTDSEAISKLKLKPSPRPSIAYILDGIIIIESKDMA